MTIRPLAALSSLLWSADVAWIFGGHVMTGVPSLLTGAAVTSTVCATIRTCGLGDRDLVALALAVGRSTPAQPSPIDAASLGPLIGEQSSKGRD